MYALVVHCMYALVGTRYTVNCMYVLVVHCMYALVVHCMYALVVHCMYALVVHCMYVDTGNHLIMSNEKIFSHNNERY